MNRLAALTAAALLGGCAPATVAAPAEPGPAPSALAAGIVDEVNAARSDPAGYARKARALRELYRGDRVERPGEIAILTQEGVAAVDEAITFLENQPPLPTVRAHPLVERAAADHAADQARAGGVGHTGGDGSSPSERMRRHARWTATGEAIAYGPDRAEDVVLQLIVDDGVPDRGHRRILFSPGYTLIGAACAPHPVWRQVCVLDFARP